MIAVVRLDERMIHGQVAIKWTRHMNINRIVVVSDAAASSNIVQKSLMMAAPPTAKVAIKSVAEALPLINDPRMEQYNAMIIVSKLDDLLTVVNNVADIPLVNVGNYGRIAAKKDSETRKMYQHNLYLYPEEADILRAVIDTGVKCNYQTVPDDAPQELSRVLKL